MGALHKEELDVLEDRVADFGRARGHKCDKGGCREQEEKRVGMC